MFKMPSPTYILPLPKGGGGFGRISPQFPPPPFGRGRITGGGGDIHFEHLVI